MWLLTELEWRYKNWGISLTVPETTNYFVSAGRTALLMRRYANKQNWRHSHNSYWEGVRHCFGHIARLDACPCTSTLLSADEHFNRMESRSSQENMDLSVPGWCWNVMVRILGRLHSLWPWKRDATVSWRLRVDDDNDELCCGNGNCFAITVVVDVDWVAQSGVSDKIAHCVISCVWLMSAEFCHRCAHRTAW